MKATQLSGKIFLLLLLAGIGSTLSSFSGKAGGEGFEIYIDGKVVIQRFGKDLNSIKQLSLDSYQNAGKLSIRYHHCGRIGKNRVLKATDAQNNFLKEWRFDDTNDVAAIMHCSLKEVTALQKNSRSKLVNLVYSSSELPQGRTLVTVALPAKTLTQP